MAHLLFRASSTGNKRRWKFSMIYCCDLLRGSKLEHSPVRNRHARLFARQPMLALAWLRTFPLTVLIPTISKPLVLGYKQGQACTICISTYLLLLGLVLSSRHCSRTLSLYYTYPITYHIIPYKTRETKQHLGLISESSFPTARGAHKTKITSLEISRPRLFIDASLGVCTFAIVQKNCFELRLTGRFILPRNVCYGTLYYHI